MVSRYSIVLSVLLASTGIVAEEDDFFFCDSVTSEVNETIAEEVNAAGLGLEYNEDYMTLAEDYGFLGDKPQNEEDYIYLDKGGSYTNEKPLKELARELTKSLMKEVKDALTQTPGRRPYGCAAFKCGDEDGVNFDFDIACVVGKAIESN